MFVELELDNADSQDNYTWFCAKMQISILHLNMYYVPTYTYWQIQLKVHVLISI